MQRVAASFCSVGKARSFDRTRALARTVSESPSLRDHVSPPSSLGDADITAARMLMNRDFNAALSRCFHVSITTRAPRRRRVRGSATPNSGASSTLPDEGGGLPGGTATRPMPVKDSATFKVAARDLLDKVEQAIEPMKACNDVFVVSRSFNEEGAELSIRLKPGDGMYKLDVDERNCSLTLSSPMSGVHSYVLCSRTNDWLGMDDGHIMEGMFVRDIIRQANGVPKF